MKHFKTYVTTFADCDSIDDATEVYADNVAQLFPEIDTPCDLSPTDQCEYSVFDPERCVHCGRKTG